MSRILEAATTTTAEAEKKNNYSSCTPKMEEDVPVFQETSIVKRMESESSSASSSSQPQPQDSRKDFLLLEKSSPSLSYSTRSRNHQKNELNQNRHRLEEKNLRNQNKDKTDPEGDDPLSERTASQTRRTAATINSHENHHHAADDDASAAAATASSCRFANPQWTKRHLQKCVQQEQTTTKRHQTKIRDIFHLTQLQQQQQQQEEHERHMILISGPPGCGKRTLASTALQAEREGCGCYFLQGSYYDTTTNHSSSSSPCISKKNPPNQNSSIPYSGLVMALTSFVSQVLERNAVAQVRNAIYQEFLQHYDGNNNDDGREGANSSHNHHCSHMATRSNLALLTSMVPALQAIVGDNHTHNNKSNSSATTTTTEQQEQQYWHPHDDPIQRFVLVVRLFLRAITKSTTATTTGATTASSSSSSSPPLFCSIVLVLHDLHLADACSWDLVRGIVTDPHNPHVLVIATTITTDSDDYNDNENTTENDSVLPYWVRQLREISGTTNIILQSPQPRTMKPTCGAPQEEEEQPQPPQCPLVHLHKISLLPCLTVSSTPSTTNELNGTTQNSQPPTSSSSSSVVSNSWSSLQQWLAHALGMTNADHWDTLQRLTSFVYRHCCSRCTSPITSGVVAKQQQQQANTRIRNPQHQDRSNPHHHDDNVNPPSCKITNMEKEEENDEVLVVNWFLVVEFIVFLQEFDLLVYQTFSSSSSSSHSDENNDQNKGGDVAMDGGRWELATPEELDVVLPNTATTTTSSQGTKPPLHSFLVDKLRWQLSPHAQSVLKVMACLENGTTMVEGPLLVYIMTNDNDDYNNDEEKKKKKSLATNTSTSRRAFHSLWGAATLNPQQLSHALQELVQEELISQQRCCYYYYYKTLPRSSSSQSTCCCANTSSGSCCCFTDNQEKDTSSSSSFSSLLLYESNYTFEHSAIREAARALITTAPPSLSNQEEGRGAGNHHHHAGPTPTVEEFHLQIGRRLWKRLSSSTLMHARKSNDDDDDDLLFRHVFVILSQIAVGRHLITDPKEQIATATLCWMAGRKAAKSSTFRMASMYLELGLDLLLEATDVAAGARSTVDRGSHDYLTPPYHHRCWRDEYDLSLGLYCAAAEMNMACGEFDKTYGYADYVLQNAQSLDDKFPAYVSKMFALSQQDRHDENMDLGMLVLQQLGEPLPRRMCGLHLKQEMRSIDKLLKHKSNEQLLRLPLMESNSTKFKASQVLGFMVLPSLSFRPQMLPFVLLKMMKITLQHGLSVLSSAAFGVYGMACIFINGDLEKATRFADLALVLFDRFKVIQYLPRLYAAVYGSIFPWTRPIPTVVESLLHAHYVGMQVGDAEYGGLCANLYCFYAMESGCNLQTILTECRRFQESLILAKQQYLLRMISPMIQMLHHFMGLSNDPLATKGDLLDFDAFEETMMTKGSFMGVTCVRYVRLRLGYVFGDIDMAERANLGIEDVMLTPPTFERATYLFFLGVVAVAVVRKERSNPQRSKSKSKNNKSSIPGQQRHYCWRRDSKISRNIKNIRMAMKTLKRYARISPHSCLDKSNLLQAELASLQGKHGEAYEKYLLAIAVSHENAQHFMHALSNELLAKHLIRLQQQQGIISNPMSSTTTFQSSFVGEREGSSSLSFTAGRLSSSSSAATSAAVRDQTVKIQKCAKDAIQSYQTWGGIAKVTRLQEEFHCLLLGSKYSNKG